MSLFGTSPDDNTSSRDIKSSLFADDRPSDRQKASSGLFADDGGSGGDSPWGFQPTPKRHARGDLVKTLLPASEVPESYIDAFEALRNNGERAGNGVTLAGARRLLNDARVGHDGQQKILDIVAPQGSTAADGLGRGEFNVLMALVGLALEGEELSLDSVDERRRRLAEPPLPSFYKRPSTPPPQKQAPAAQPATPNAFQPQSQSPTQPRSTPAASKQHSVAFPDADPWATTPATSKANGASESRAAVFTRTTSEFSNTTLEQTTRSESLIGQKPNPIESSASDWTPYGAASVSGYTPSGLGGSTFGGSLDDEREEVVPKLPSKFSNRAQSAGYGVQEEVTVASLPEKEGMFLFQYRNYEVTTIRRNSKVARRYSDFVWLLDCLQKKYPFRQLPLLPPKRVATADGLFIEKRRRGLARFANALVRHPVLSQEQLVVMFLTVPTELSVWRKQAAITVMEEFTGKPLPPTLEDSLPPTLDELFETVRTGVRRSADAYISLCSILERLIKRKDGLAGEYLRFSTALSATTEASADTYRADVNDVPLLNEGINATAKHMATSQGLLIDEARAWDEGTLEDFKRHRDALVSMRDMFDRRDRFARDNIPALEKRIAGNEGKLATVRAKPEALRKPNEAEKLEEAIMKDKESIVAQHARGVFIKECVRDEINIFQATQYQISRMHQDWSAERVKYAEMQADCWRQLTEQVEGMPLSSE